VSSSFSGGEPDYESGRLEEMANSTTEEFANLEAAEKLTRERWHQRLAKLLRLRADDD
jgi:hypothetical protein